MTKSNVINMFEYNNRKLKEDKPVERFFDKLERMNRENAERMEKERMEANKRIARRLGRK